MLADSKVVFHGNHFTIDGKTKVTILTNEDVDRLEKEHQFFSERNYDDMGEYTITNPDKSQTVYRFVSLGTDGQIYTLPPKIKK